MAAKPTILFFKDIDKSDISSVGGKGANLGEMTQAGFPVPNGFAVTVASYDLFLNENKRSAIMNRILSNGENAWSLKKAIIRLGKKGWLIAFKNPKRMMSILFRSLLKIILK